MAAILKAAATKDPLSAKDLLLISKQADVLEYIAFLANTNMIDKSYLSVAIICEIVLTNQAMKRLKELVPPLAKSPEHQIQDFSRTAANPAATIKLRHYQNFTVTALLTPIPIPVTYPQPAHQGRHYDRSARSIAALWLAGSRVTPA